MGCRGRSFVRTVVGVVSLLGLGGAEKAFAAIGTPVLLGTFGSRTTATSTSVTLGAAVATGQTVIVTLAIEPVVGAASCGDSVGGNTWNVDADVTDGSGSSGVRTVICSGAISVPLPINATVTVTHPSSDRQAMTASSVSG